MFADLKLDGKNGEALISRDGNTLRIVPSGMNGVKTAEEDWWESREYNLREKARAFRYSFHAACPKRFVTLLQPGPADAISFIETTSNAVVLGGEQGKFVLLFGKNGTTIENNRVSSDGLRAFAHVGPDGAPAGAMLRGGTQLTVDGNTVLERADHVECLSREWR